MIEINQQLDEIKLFRKRYKPMEIVHLMGDKILHVDDNHLITKWNVLKPRGDISCGYSCYYLKEGYKVSYFISPDNEFLYWYCDILETIYDRDKNEYIFNDLLLDVVVDRENNVQVVDIKDLADALCNGLISQKQATDALYSLDKLLESIYEGNFKQLTNILREHIDDRKHE